MDRLDNSILSVVGRESDGGCVRNYVIEHNLYKKIMVGFCDDVDQIWLNADLNLFLNINDGFGLSIIEGLMRGECQV